MRLNLRPSALNYAWGGEEVFRALGIHDYSGNDVKGVVVDDRLGFVLRRFTDSKSNLASLVYRSLWGRYWVFAPYPHLLRTYCLVTMDTCVHLVNLEDIVLGRAKSPSRGPSVQHAQAMLSDAALQFALSGRQGLPKKVVVGTFKFIDHARRTVLDTSSPSTLHAYMSTLEAYAFSIQNNLRT